MCKNIYNLLYVSNIGILKQLYNNTHSLNTIALNYIYMNIPYNIYNMRVRMSLKTKNEKKLKTIKIYNQPTTTNKLTNS